MREQEKVGKKKGTLDIVLIWCEANQLEDAGSFTLLCWNVCLLESSAEAAATDCQLGDWI